MRELHARLVGATGVEDELEHRALTPSTENADLRHRLLGAAHAAVDDAHRAVAVRRESVAERHPLLAARQAGDACDVRLLDAAAFELLGQAGVGLPPFREDEETARVAVEPLVNAEVTVASARHEKALQARDHVVRAIGIRGLGGDAGRLVDDDDIGVVVHHPVIAKVRPYTRAVHRATASITDESTPRQPRWGRLRRRCVG